MCVDWGVCGLRWRCGLGDYIVKLICTGVKYVIVNKDNKIIYTLRATNKESAKEEARVYMSSWLCVELNTEDLK